MTDVFVKFNRKRIDERQMDTMIGLCKGIAADGRVNQLEAEFLHSWLIQARHATQNPIVVNLCERVSSFLVDGVLDDGEVHELLSLLHQIAGEAGVVGELAKPASLPLDEPPPTIIFPQRIFAFTGTFVFGTRKECHSVTEKLGGINASGITRAIHYLVIGSYVTDSWVHETFGRKIEKAMTYRQEGCPLAIITEEHWAKAGKLI